MSQGDAMTNTREFDLSDILSVVPGCLVSSRHMDGVYDILNFMTGDNLFTHQLPRAIGECEGPLVEQHPWLADVVTPAWKGTTNEELRIEVDAWVAELKAIHGECLPVTPLEDWHRMDPIQELAELTERPDRIIVVDAS
jgi:hypothetical protein